MQYYYFNKKNNSGQALTEYVLLLLLVAGFVFLLFGMMPRIFAKLEEPIKVQFALSYRNGAPNACGHEDTVGTCSGPKNHPRIDQAENFRLFGRK
jgi:hypothetical protein